MDTPSAVFLKDQLIQFGQSVSETARHLSAPSGAGSWHAGTLFAEKCRVRDLLNSSPLPPEEKTVLVQEYNRIVDELDALLRKQGQICRDLLLMELEKQVYTYHAEICLSSYWCDNECVRSGRERRELIGELVVQLRSYYPLSALEALVATIDDNAVVDEVAMPDRGSSKDFRSRGLPTGCIPESDASVCDGTRSSARHV